MFSIKFWTPKNNAATKGILGLSAAGTLAMGLLITPWEKRVYTTYIDRVGGIEVPTVCAGVTGPDVIIGKTYSDPECDHLEAKHIKIAETAVLTSLTYPAHDYTKASFISFTYNVGVGAFKRSTLLKKANAGDLRGACDQLSRWIFVNGKAIKGLENRRVNGDKTRISEHNLCMMGVDPNYQPPIFDTVYASFIQWRSS